MCNTFYSLSIDLHRAQMRLASGVKYGTTEAAMAFSEPLLKAELISVFRHFTNGMFAFHQSDPCQ